MGLPPEAQDDIARLVLQLASDDEPMILLTGAERAAIGSSRAPPRVASSPRTSRSARCGQNTVCESPVMRRPRRGFNR